ncbi:MAG: hypothetical protein JZU63_05385, partial [Rhodoferax sp.]|nr:hypothetical protein [Rhodoferax sp.]
MGNYPGIIECSGGADNYYSFVYENGDLRVDPKALTITADNRSKTYGTLYTFLGTEFTATGLVPGDTVTSATLSSTGSPTSAPASPPTYPILISNAVGTGLGNYTITYVPGAMTVA